ncbi:hypothetical protein [Xanthobacter sp. ZOL 2024]
MNTVIAFPTKHERATRATSAARRPKADGARPDLAGPRIVILPVVRIERHADPVSTLAQEQVTAQRGTGCRH